MTWLSTQLKTRPPSRPVAAFSSVLALHCRRYPLVMLSVSRAGTRWSSMLLCLCSSYPPSLLSFIYQRHDLLPRLRLTSTILPSRPEIYFPSSFVSAFFLSFPPLLRAWTYPSPYIAFSLPRAPLLPWCVDLYSLLLWGVFVFLGSAALVLGCRVYAMHRRVLLRTYLGS